MEQTNKISAALNDDDDGGKKHQVIGLSGEMIKDAANISKKAKQRMMRKERKEQEEEEANKQRWEQLAREKAEL